MQYQWPNCAKTIKAEINTVRDELERILGDDLLTIYLIGSLALGGFNPNRSDIDVLIVTRQRFDALAKKAIIQLLLRMSRVPCPIDAYFLAEKDLETHKHYFHFNESLREYYQQALHSVEITLPKEANYQPSDLTIDLFVAKKQAVALYGPPAQEVLPNITAEEFQTALKTNATQLRTMKLRDPISFVLNSCRILAYLRTHELLSKEQGGTWGLIHLPEQFHPLIQQTLALYQGERLSRPVGRAAFDEFEQYLEREIQ